MADSSVKSAGNNWTHGGMAQTHGKQPPAMATDRGTQSVASGVAHTRDKQPPHKAVG